MSESETSEIDINTYYPGRKKLGPRGSKAKAIRRASSQSLDDYYQQLTDILEARKTFESLPNNEQSVATLDKIVGEMVYELRKELDDMELLHRDRQALAHILRVSSTILGDLSKQETLKTSTDRISIFTDRLLRRFEEIYVKH